MKHTQLTITLNSVVYFDDTKKHSRIGVWYLTTFSFIRGSRTIVYTVTSSTVFYTDGWLIWTSVHTSWTVHCNM